jgi:hypothetical protein
VAIASSTTTTSSSSSSSETGSDIAVPVPVACTHGPIKDAAVAGVAGGAPAAELATMDKGVAAAPSGLCPVVAFASFAAQLSFKAILHVMVFGGGFCLGTEGMCTWHNMSTCNPPPRLLNGQDRVRTSQENAGKVHF